jgi:hypothetical protein
MFTENISMANEGYNYMRDIWLMRFIYIIIYKYILQLINSGVTTLVPGAAR